MSQEYKSSRISKLPRLNYRRLHQGKVEFPVGKHLQRQSSVWQIKMADKNDEVVIYMDGNISDTDGGAQAVMQQEAPTTAKAVMQQVVSESAKVVIQQSNTDINPADDDTASFSCWNKDPMDMSRQDIEMEIDKLLESDVAELTDKEFQRLKYLKEARNEKIHRQQKKEAQLAELYMIDVLWDTEQVQTQVEQEKLYVGIAEVQHTRDEMTKTTAKITQICWNDISANLWPVLQYEVDKVMDSVQAVEAA